MECDGCTPPIANIARRNKPKMGAAGTSDTVFLHGDNCSGLRNTKSTRRNTLRLWFASRKCTHGLGVKRMTQTMSHKAESLEMHHHINSIPEEVPGGDGKDGPSSFIPAECTICR